MDIQEKGEYIEVVVTGEYTRKNALVLFEKLLIYSAVRGTNKALIDLRKIEGENIIFDLFEMSKKATYLQDDYDETGRTHYIKKAFLFDEEKFDLDTLKDVVYDKNKDHFILTLDHDEAMMYLGAQ